MAATRARLARSAAAGSAKVKAAEKFDGKFVVISNDDTLSAEDIALGYKGGWIIEVLLPADETDRARGAADVSLDAAPDRGACQALRAGAADATGRRDPLSAPWARIAHALGALKAVRYRSEGGLLFSARKSPPSWPTR